MADVTWLKRGQGRPDPKGAHALTPDVADGATRHLSPVYEPDESNADLRARVTALEAEVRHLRRVEAKVERIDLLLRSFGAVLHQGLVQGEQ